MLKNPGKFYVFLICLLLSTGLLSCSAPQYVWPQKNIEMNDVNDPSLEKKVLVAARSSDFKDAVAAKIKKALEDERVYIRFIGVDELEKEDAASYSAVIMINTCMAWKMDRHVRGFLKRHEDQSNIIVLTTSGDGDWMPDMEKYSFDAISSASEMSQVDAIADEIISKSRTLMQSG